jgi:hypothetical protein
LPWTLKSPLVLRMVLVSVLGHTLTWEGTLSVWGRMQISSVCLAAARLDSYLSKYTPAGAWALETEVFSID